MSGHERKLPTDLLPLIERLVDGTIDDVGFARLDTILRGQVEARRLYRRYINIHATLPGIIGHTSQLSIQFKDDPDGVIACSHEPSNAEFLRLLMQVEATGRKLPVPEIYGNNRSSEVEEEQEKRSLSPGDIAVVSTYLIRRSLTAKLMAISMAAAVFALGIVLFVQFTETVNPTNETTQVPGPVHGPTVARLTGEHDAIWHVPTGDVSPSVGDELYAGQMLMLMHGFAEIMTSSGAKASFEAPCKIELTETDNVIRLHHGKLVGIVESDDAKGFLVRTPHMDVIDRGTRFGVLVEEGGEVLAEVFEGHVEVKSTARETRHLARRSLYGGDSVAIDSSGREMSREAFEPESFDRLKEFNAGIVALSGDVRWLPNPMDGVELVDWITGHGTIATEELLGYRLERDISVNLRGPGNFLQFNGPADPEVVPRNTVIRSYLLLLNPGPTTEIVVSRGSITFKGEILGVISSEDQWNAFLPQITNKFGRVFAISSHRSLLESSQPDETADEIVLAEDGRTLSFKFVTDGFADTVRVIVREPAEGDTP